MLRTRSLLAGLLLLLLVGPAFAQVRRPRQRNIQQMVERAVNSQKIQLNRQMSQRLDEIDRVCKLESKQKKRLQIAAKGAVGRSLEHYEKYIESVYNRQFNRNRLNPAKAAALLNRARPVTKKKAVPATKKKAKPAQGKKAKPAKEKKRQVLPRPAVRPIPLRIAYKRPIPWQQKIWLITIKKTLNDSQSDAFDKHLQARRQFNRRNGVGVFVSQMDQQLLLTAAQRDALEKLVDQQFGKALETTVSNQVFALQGWIGMDANGRRRTRRLPQENLKTILSPSQFTAWNQRARRFLRPAMIMAKPAIARPVRPIRKPLKKATKKTNKDAKKTNKGAAKQQ